MASTAVTANTATAKSTVTATGTGKRSKRSHGLKQQAHSQEHAAVYVKCLFLI
jgi:hypothetical protein